MGISTKIFDLTAGVYSYFYNRVFALKELNLKIPLKKIAERTLKEELLQNGMKIPI